MTLSEIANNKNTNTNDTANLATGVSKDASLILSAKDDSKTKDPITPNAIGNNKKRTKASRACDQCRKKKIKCDYNELKSICTNCQKSKDKCAFERIPLKRGPSKGYNKVYKTTKQSENLSLANNHGIILGNTTSNSHTDTTVDNTFNNDPLNLNKSRQNSSGSFDQIKHDIVPSSSILLPPLSQYMNQQNGSMSNYLLPNTDKKLPGQETSNQNIESINKIPNSALRNNSSVNIGQQQFWKVPYHEFTHQKRGSVDSLPSDLSARNVNNQESLMYNGLQHQLGFSNFQPQNIKTGINNANTTTLNENANNTSINNSNNDNASRGNNSAYWSYLGTFNSANNQDYQEIQSRRSSSIPSVLRQTTNSIMLSQTSIPQTTPTQPAYPYSQFHQQPITDHRVPLTTSISSFGQYATAGFHTRNSSIVSEAMSPSAPAQDSNESNQQHIHTTLANIKRASVDKVEQKSTLPNLDLNTNNNETTDSIRNNSTSSIEKQNIAANANSVVYPTDNVNHVALGSTESNKLQTVESKTSVLKRSNSLSIVRNRSNSVASINSIMDPIEPTKLEGSTTMKKSTDISNTPEIRVGKNTENITSLESLKYSNLNTNSITNMIYNQIPDHELINIYYEFIHEGFPIIPLNKETLTNDILIINTQPLSIIHELNNYVIMWFRNSLELLVKLALKDNRKSSYFLLNRFDNSNGNDNKTNSPYNRKSTVSSNTDTVNKDDDSKAGDMFEVQTIFITALNECFQKIVDVHPKFRENKDLISPKIKVIYLSTFIVLNYILSYAGYDNSFVLGMSVTIFNEFKIYKLLLLENNILSDREIEKDPLEMGCNVMFKRLYVLLIIFDSLQSCTFGGPKLLNIPIRNVTDTFFDDSKMSLGQSKFSEEFKNKWCVDKDITRMSYISQSLKLGEFITELSMSRKSINSLILTKNSTHELVWTPKTTTEEEPNKVISTLHLFHDLLIIKHKFVNKLILLNPEDELNKKFDLDTSAEIAEIISSLIAYILQILTLTMRLNPTNSIDVNLNPNEIKQPAGEEMMSAGITHQNDIGDTNNFYQKLLGLNKDRNHDIMENSKRGIITPFAISIIYELHNIVSIIKQLPTKLIALVMEVAHVDNAKAQKIVVSLSNSMNEVVQIMSLIIMIKPFKIFDSNLNERVISSQNPDDLVMKWKFFDRCNIKHTDDTCEEFINVGWRLLDDSELGWL